ncbi:Gluconolactonase [Nocardia otitidiscaviarum]|uniref:Gluconolactonase n=1 Tax=Nocardia otitidiscaviarum TaxID=1823 RepID=A0A379JGV2_9NOCA|nr:SMP-30/gluconolactonase/LRE family protein [Nocardia otitidiscaviarum]SUD47869.1 Gluconolactonase [Nocardia otitidiscaviarum]
MERNRGIAAIAARPTVRLPLAAGAAALAAVVAIAPAPASAEPGGCTAVTTTALPLRIPVLDWAESIGVDDRGNVWVGRMYRNVVERYNPSGELTATVPVAFPGAIAFGPDGLLYVNTGNAPFSAITRTGGVVRLDPTAAAPRPEPFVSGLGMANGADFDAAGNLYVGDTTAGVVRIRPDGTVDADWTARAPKTVSENGLAVNGITVQGDSVFVTLMGSPAARVLRVPIADPGHPTVAADLAAAPFTAPALPDDLTVGPDGRLYVATTSGHLVRVDSETHATCTVLAGEPMTAVAAGPGRDLLVSTESGTVLRVRLD